QYMSIGYTAEVGEPFVILRHRITAQQTVKHTGEQIVIYTLGHKVVIFGESNKNSLKSYTEGESNLRPRDNGQVFKDQNWRGYGLLSRLLWSRKISNRIRLIL